MSNEETAGQTQPSEDLPSSDYPQPQLAGEPVADPLSESVTGSDEQHIPVEIEHAPVEVGLQRSVRYGRLLIAGAVLGALVGTVSSLFFPVEEGAGYELGQAVGVALVFGGAIGLGLGGIVALLLGISAKRKRGAAMAVQTDVR